MMEFAYNDHLHSSIGVSPFYVLYGQECRTSIILSIPNTKFENINDMITEMNRIRKLVKLTIKSSHHKNKYLADNKRLFSKFKGDKVFLKVVPNQFGLKLGMSKNYH